MIYHDIPWCTNQWADAVKMLKGTVFSMTSDQLYHTGEKRSCDVACTACILLSLEVWLSVLITFMFYICFIYALYMFYHVLSHLNSKVATARPSESLTCRAFSKLVSPGNPWVPRLLSHHWMVVTRHRHRWKRSGLFAAEKLGAGCCWVKRRPNDLNCYHLEGDSLMSHIVQHIFGLGATEIKVLGWMLDVDIYNIIQYVWSFLTLPYAELPFVKVVFNTGTARREGHICSKGPYNSWGCPHPPPWIQLWIAWTLWL